MFVIKILANRDAIFFVSSDQNMLQPDFVDTFNGFVVHPKWIRCTPEMDFVDTISLNIFINPHTETALFIALSTHKPTLLRDLSRANLYIGFLQQYSVHRGFCGYL